MKIDEFLSKRLKERKKIQRYLDERGYINDSLVVFYFINDRLKIDPESWVFKKDLYEAYLEYCRSQMIPSTISKVFFKVLRSQVRLRDYRPQIEGRRYRAIKGLCLRVQSNRKTQRNPIPF